MPPLLSRYFDSKAGGSKHFVKEGKKKQDKSAVMASRPKTNWCYQKFLNKTFEGGSLDSSTAKEILFGHDNHAEEEDDGYDGPVVFICAKCRLPVGDSLSWDGSEYEENQIKLKRRSEVND